MKSIALALLMTGVASAEPVRELPQGLHAVPIQRGMANLIVDGKPQDVPTALPAGWYFTAEGYDTLNTATVNLQASMRELEVRAQAFKAPCEALAAPTPIVVKPVTGWQTRTLVIAVVAFTVIGFGVGATVAK